MSKTVSLKNGSICKPEFLRLYEVSKEIETTGPSFCAQKQEQLASPNSLFIRWCKRTRPHLHVRVSLAVHDQSGGPRAVQLKIRFCRVRGTLVTTNVFLTVIASFSAKSSLSPTCPGASSYGIYLGGRAGHGATLCIHSQEHFRFLHTSVGRASESRATTAGESGVCRRSFSNSSISNL